MIQLQNVKTLLDGVDIELLQLLVPQVLCYNLNDLVLVGQLTIVGLVGYKFNGHLLGMGTSPKGASLTIFISWKKQ